MKNWKKSGYPDNGAKVQQIVLLGERNSGTNWVTSLLSSCFPTIPVNTYLSRWKHWFQDDIDENFRVKTHVVVSVVNPYDWLDLMRRIPRDEPNHMYNDDTSNHQQIGKNYNSRQPIDWKTFVTRPWTMPRPSLDYNTTGIRGIEERYCQSRFRFQEVVPCMLSDRQMQKEKMKIESRYVLLNEGFIRPFPDIWNTEQFEPPHAKTGQQSPLYEMKRNKPGEPYASIIDMRRDKLLNHMSVQDWEWVKGFTLAPIEQMGNKVFVGSFLNEISLVVGIDATCKNLPKPKFSSNLDNFPIQFIEWVTNHTDWDTEALIGYLPNPDQR